MKGTIVSINPEKRLKRLNDIWEVSVAWLKSPHEKASNFFPLKVTDFFWWKLDKYFFNLDEDIFVCSVYIPPANSKYFGQSKIDPYDELESDLIHCGKLGKIMLMGDFNSRKGRLDDTPEFNLGAVPFTDSFVEEPVFQDATMHPSSKKLHSMDQTTNKYGRSLTNICISHNLRF